MKTNSDLALNYTTRSAHWNEAMPLGNGRLGAMVFGDPISPRIHLNEDTFYGGGPNRVHQPDSIAGDIKTVTDLLENGRNFEAHLHVLENWLARPGAQYQPVGDVVMHMHDTSDVTEYHRQLDLETALYHESFMQSGTRFSRECFVSQPDQVIVMTLTADQPGALNFDLALHSIHPTVLSSIRQGNLRMQVKAPVLGGRRPIKMYHERERQGFYPEYFGPDGRPWAYMHPDLFNDVGATIYNQDGSNDGMLAEAAIEIDLEDGNASLDGYRYNITNATRATIRISLATSFNGFRTDPVREGKDFQALNDRMLEESRKSLDELRTRHLDEYQPLFSRVSLRLGQEGASAETGLSTDQRLKRFHATHDPALAELVFQYGRYLLISSARAGSQPPNLQGIWNDNPMQEWASNYTMNINLQMNHWPAEVTGLPEMHEPLFDMVEELAVNGADRAKNMFGMPGWLAFHNATIWREVNVTQWDPASAFWPMAAPWLMAHFWEHYQHNGDVDFLKNRAYPLMKGAAEFLAAWLTETRDGHLVTKVSTSPENRFIDDDGRMCTIDQGTTMDIALTREHFENTAEAAAILGLDAELAARLRDMAARLRPFAIGSEGQLLEWSREVKEWDRTHRHVSHLYPVFPGNQITPETPDLFAAVRKSLEIRGNKATGWSMGWKLCLWARLHDAAQAHEIINNMMTHVPSDAPKSENGGLFSNLTVAHPPFQVDGNFGYTRGVVEMLMQAPKAGAIGLLPALPDNWPDGQVSGLRAPGGITVGFSWTDGRIARLTLQGPADAAVVVRHPDAQGNMAQWDAKLDASGMATYHA